MLKLFKQNKHDTICDILFHALDAVLNGFDLIWKMSNRY